MRADFQQYYGLNLDDLFIKYSLRHAADLSVMLPAGSRVMTAINPKNAWTLTDTILSRIEYWAHMNVYAKTEDAKHKRNRPEPLFTTKEKQKQTGEVHSIDETKNILSRKRR